MRDYRKDLIDAKYHLAVVKRMFETYHEFEDKRVLIGIINELAKASSSLIRAYLIFDGVLGKNYIKNLEIFAKKVGPTYLDRLILDNILKTLEVERSQKISPIEYAKNDKIILLISGKYRFLTARRLEEFFEAVNFGVKSFPEKFRQI